MIGKKNENEMKKKKNEKWLSWKPERAAQSEKERLIWNELKPEVVVLIEMIRVGKLKWEIGKEKLRNESEESYWHLVLQGKGTTEAWVSSKRLKTSVKD